MFSLLTYLFVSLIYHGIQNDFKGQYLSDQIDFVTKNTTSFAQFQEVVAKLNDEHNVIIHYEYRGDTYSCPLESECFKYKIADEQTLPEKYDNLISGDLLLDVDGDDLLVLFYKPVSKINDIQVIQSIYLPLFMIITTILVSGIAYYLAMKLSKPVMILDKAAKKLTDLDFDIYRDLNSNDEFGDLSLSLVNLANKLRESIQSLQEANEKLNDDISLEKAKEQRLRSVIAMLSHDLKTPLTSIKGQTEGMLYNVGKYKDHTRYLGENLLLIGNIEQMISSIIVSSQLDDQPFSLSLVELNVKDVFQEQFSNMEYTIEVNKIKLNTIYVNEIYTVDSFLFNKVINNLISNALEYCDRNGEITVELYKERISISNTNVNFDLNALKNDLIFKPFYRQDLARNRKGTGLGLDIVKKICDIHNIEINIEYVKNIFKISLNFPK